MVRFNNNDCWNEQYFCVYLIFMSLRRKYEVARDRELIEGEEVRG